MSARARLGHGASRIPEDRRTGGRRLGAVRIARRMGCGRSLPGIRSVVEASREAAIKRIQDWIALPSIAAENRNMKEGVEYMAALARSAGFDQATIVPTDGHPGVYATMDNGAKRTLGLYFMYDVKQYDAAEWSSPPLAGRDRRQAGIRTRRHGPWRGQSERAGGHPARRPARHARSQGEAAGESGARRRGRGRNRLTALSADRAPPRNHRRVEEG